MRTLHRAIVTGATGAVGTALVRVLAERDIAVTVLCRPGSVRRENIPQHPRVRVCFADLTRLREAAVELDDSCDAFFHLAWTGTVGAARNDMFQQNKNVEYALEAVELAASLGARFLWELVVRRNTAEWRESFAQIRLCSRKMGMASQNYARGR